MAPLVLLLAPIAFCLSLPLTWAIIRASHRLGALDSEPIAGQQKMARRAIPNTGGVAIFAAIALPMLAGLALLPLAGDQLAAQFPALAEHLPGIRAETPAAIVLLACLAGLHVLGLVDDRRPLGPVLKLGVILILSCVAVVLTETRLLHLLDPLAGGRWLSVLVTILWFGVVTNAMNFMDNMDGLAGGAGAVASATFLAAALVNGQWFVAAVLALLLGAIVGFLVFNWPPANVFMGDGGSLVIGFLLAFLTTRTTFYDPEAGGGVYGLFMPLLVLAIPLYDFLSVTAIRLSQGRSPFVGDLQHFSHRLQRRGLSTRQTATVVCGLTAITSIGGVALASLEPWQAILVVVQTLLILLVLALFEHASSRGAADA